MSKQGKWFWPVTGLALSAGLIGFAIYSHVHFKDTIERNFNNQQEALVKSIKASVESHFAEVDQALQFIAGELSAGNDIDRSRDVISSFYGSHQGRVHLMGVFDQSGNFIAAAARFQGHLPPGREVMHKILLEIGSSEEPLLTERYNDEAGGVAAGIVVPFSLSDGTRYYLFADFYFTDFIDSELVQVLEDQDICVFSCDDTGNVLSIHNPYHESQSFMVEGNLIELDDSCLSCHRKDDFVYINKSIDTGDIVHTITSYPEEGPSNTATVAMQIYNRWISISICTPFRSIQSVIDSNFIITSVSSLLLIVLLGIVGLGFYRSQRREIHFKMEGDRLRAEAEGETRFRNLTDNLNVGVYRNTPGPRGGFLLVNPSVVRMFGFESAAAMEKIAVTDLYENPEDRNDFNRIMEEKLEVRNFEVQLKRKDGTPFSGSVSVRAVTDDEGNIQYYDGIIEDMTKRKRLEEQSRFNERLESVRMLSKKVTHDFNNLLTAAIGYTDMLLNRDDMREDVRRSLNKISEAHERMKLQVARLSDFAGTGFLNTVDFNLVDLVNKWKNEIILEMGEQVELVIEEYSGELPIHADWNQIRRMLNYVVENAVEGMPEGGKIRIELKRIELTDELFDPMGFQIDPGNYAVVKITDNGKGMTDEELRDAFLPHLATREVGRGKGLLLPGVGEIVRRNHGSMLVYGNEEGGTTFELFLPIANEPGGG